jgi:hypothetical protein
MPAVDLAKEPETRSIPIKRPAESGLEDAGKVDKVAKMS